MTQYQQKGYWLGETLSDMLARLAQTFKHKIALEDDTQQWSFKALHAKSNQLAAGLHRLGLRAGDCVVVQLPNVPEFYALLFALIRLGVKPLLALPAHRALEITSFCHHLQAKAYFFPNHFNGYDYLPLAREIRTACDSVVYAIALEQGEEFTGLNTLYDAEQSFPDREASDVALFLVSGGSTGIPKIIPRTHDDYGYSFRESAKICGVTAKDVYLCTLPAAHNFALSSPGALGVLHEGGKVLLCKNPTPQAAFEWIVQGGVTMTALTPPLIRLWLESATPALFKGLRLLQVGGARLDSETAAIMMKRFNLPLQQVFGMAEGLVCYTQIADSMERIIAAEVLPISGADEVKILNENGDAVGVEQTGSLLVRGPYTLRGYWNSTVLNAMCFDKEGFYRTGDLVKRTADGRLVVMGRTKDIVNRGGEIFSTEEVEMHLRQHPAVIDAAVFAEQNLRMGELSCAVVLSRAPITAYELRQYLRLKGLATFKIPDRIEFVDHLAQTAVGKIDKNQLRNLYTHSS